MRNLKAMKRSAVSAGQKGFTIIELVVVILLLGILTATALPRFIDVTDEAKDAVRDATAGGLRTGLALIRAASVAGNVASGSAPTATSDYTLTVDGNGYPLFSNGCQTIYEGLLQTGFTPATATDSGVGCSIFLSDVSRTIFLSPASGVVLAL